MRKSVSGIKTVFCLLIALTICSCEYETPLVEEAVIPVDPALTGRWRLIPEEGKTEAPDGKMMILPFSANEYVVICSSDDEGSMVFRAYPVRVEDMQMIQLEWLNGDPSSKDRYHVCRYSLEDGILTVETLNDHVVGRGITDAQALRETLLVNRNNPGLFKNPEHYRKIKE